MSEGLIDGEAQPRGDWKSRKSRNRNGWGKERLRPRQKMAGWAYWVLVLKSSGHAGVLPSPCLMCVKKSLLACLPSLCALSPMTPMIQSCSSPLLTVPCLTQLGRWSTEVIYHQSQNNEYQNWKIVCLIPNHSLIVISSRTSECYYWYGDHLMNYIIMLFKELYWVSYSWHTIKLIHFACTI